MDNNFYLMEHRGSLDESLKTRKEITFALFLSYLRSYDYRYYCYDERISCVRFILNEHEKHFDLPCWILMEVKK